MRKKCNRKRYVPGAYIAKHTPIAKDNQDKLAVHYHLSLEAMRRGYGSEQAWQSLADAVNISLCMAESNGLKRDNFAEINQASCALVTCRDRFKSSGKWGMTGDELKSVMRAMAIYDEQNAMATVSQQVRSLTEVRVRMEMGDIR